MCRDTATADANFIISNPDENPGAVIPGADGDCALDQDKPLLSLLAIAVCVWFIAPVLARLAIALFLAAAPVGQAAELSVGVPVVGGSEIFFNVHITNNDNGAVYNSGELQTVAALAGQLAASLSTTVTDITAVWNYDINGLPDGEVRGGWSVILMSDGSISLATTSPFGVQTWHATQQNASSDEMSVTIGIPLVQLERNGTPGYQPLTLSAVSDPAYAPADWDVTVVRSDSPLLTVKNYAGSATAGPVAGAFVGIQDIDNSYPATGLVYHAVEPGDFTPLTTFALSHPHLDPDGDANGNGASNFVDYASGADPESPAAASLTLAAGQLVFRERIDAADASAVHQFSADLASWKQPVEKQN